MAVPEGIGREAGFKDVFSKIIIENSPGMEKELGYYMLNWQRIPKRVNQK